MFQHSAGHRPSPSVAGARFAHRFEPGTARDAPVSPNEERSILFIPSFGSPTGIEQSCTGWGEMKQNEIAANFLLWDTSVTVYVLDRCWEVHHYTKSREVTETTKNTKKASLGCIVLLRLASLGQSTRTILVIFYWRPCVPPTQTQNKAKITLQ